MALWSFKTFVNHLIWNSDSEHASNCQSDMFSVDEALLCYNRFKISMVTLSTFFFNVEVSLWVRLPVH